MKTVFFGSSDFVRPVLDEIEENFDLVASFNSAHQKINPDEIRKLNPDIFVVASFGKILSGELLEIPKFGCINIHPSLLPKYRGASPIQSAILNGDQKTGVTIIKMDEEMDHGPILFQTEEPIRPDDTFESLSKRLFTIGAQNISQTIKQYIKDDLKPAAQGHSKATFTKLLEKKDGFIDSGNPPPREKLDRMIRAYFPWPGAWAKWKMKNGELRIIKLLPENKIQVEGKKPMSFKDFANGYREGEEILKKLNLG
jgi:methionyl-tRNA formyltransferase